MKTSEKLAALRARMARLGLDAYLVPTADAHLSEYVPDVWQRRRWLSGFTGSAGDLLVTDRDAALWTDARYYLQAAAELRGSGIRLCKMQEPAVPSLAEFLGRTLAAGGAVGIDPRLVSLQRCRELERELCKSGAGKIELVESNLVDEIWLDHPSLPLAPFVRLPGAHAGETSASKLRRVRRAMTEKGADALVVSALDEIAWLFNLRGSDIAFNPVAIAYAMVTASIVELFVHPEKVPPSVRRALGARVTIRAYDEVADASRDLARRRASVWIDDVATSMWIVRHLEGARLVEEPSPVARLKARKNAVEIAGMQNAHVRDGVALVRFLAWLDEAVPRGGVTEISAAEKLLAFRADGENFQGASFRTISGYGPHGAIVHYTVTDKTNVRLRPDGIYLVDSGGHYLDGTTDVTRTVLLGKRPSAEQKDRYTRVLKGVIGLSTVVFPEGVRGLRLDSFARRALWDAGLDYGHGTGHGVGMYLSVHEGPQSIGVKCRGAALEEGNVLSNEPGFYADGSYGMRIENLILVRREGKASRNGRVFLGFETLTLCPLERRLIDRALLSGEEIDWVNGYHRRVERTLRPRLRAKDRGWLERACAKL